MNHNNQDRSDQNTRAERLFCTRLTHSRHFWQKTLLTSLILLGWMAAGMYTQAKVPMMDPTQFPTQFPMMDPTQDPTQDSEFTHEQGLQRLGELNAQWQQGLPPDSMLIQADILLSRADKSDLPQLKGQIFEFLYQYFKQKRLPQEGINALEERFTRHRSSLTELLQTETEIYIALLHYELRELSRVEEIFERLLPRATNPRIIAVIQTNWANVKTDIGDFEASIDLHLKATEYYRNTENNFKLAGIYLNVGSVFIRMDEPEKALEYFSLARETAEGIDQPELQITILSNIGIVYKLQEQYEQALEIYEEGLRQSEEAGIPLRVAQNLLNIANIQLDTGRPELAAENYLLVIDISRENQIPYGQALAYINLTSAYYDMKEYDNGLEAADSALVYTDRIGLGSEKNPLMKKISELHEAKGDYRRSLEASRAYIEGYIKLNDEEKRRNIAEIEEKYENEIKDQQIAIVEQELQVASLQGRVLFVGLVFFGVMFAATVFYYRTRNRYLQDLYDRNVELMKTDSVAEKKPETVVEITAEEDLYQRILLMFQEKKIYLNPALSLRDISMAVNSNDKYVSSTVAEKSGMNVSSLINLYRVNEAKRLILKHPQIPVQEVMDESGFNSRTTFYNSFRKVTGMSPSQFMKRSQDR